MIRLLIEDAIAGTEARALEDIRMDMEHAWARFAQRFLLLEVSHELTAQLARSKDKDVAKLARKFPRKASRAAAAPGQDREGKRNLVIRFGAFTRMPKKKKKREGARRDEPPARSVRGAVTKTLEDLGISKKQSQWQKLAPMPSGTG